VKTKHYILISLKFSSGYKPTLKTQLIGDPFSLAECILTMEVKEIKRQH